MRQPLKAVVRAADATLRPRISVLAVIAGCIVFSAVAAAVAPYSRHAALGCLIAILAGMAYLLHRANRAVARQSDALGKTYYIWKHTPRGGDADLAAAAWDARADARARLPWWRRALRAVGRTFVAVLLGIAIFLVALFVASLRT